MLRFLSIRNLAVIDRLEIEFERGLNVLSGETGAGKSILVGAVGLLVGGRASADLVRTGEDAAAIEAIFETPDGRELVVRREIASQGRSRASVDGALVTSGALRELCGPLVDLHGQHEHQVLLDPAAHLDLVDEFAGAGPERRVAGDAFGRWQALAAERDRLTTLAREQGARRIPAFQLAEIERSAPRPGEDDELAALRQVLANADGCSGCRPKAMTRSTWAIAPRPRARHGSAPPSAISPASIRVSAPTEGRDAVESQLEDLAHSLRSHGSTIDASPGRLQEVEDRLAVLERLKRKRPDARRRAAESRLAGRDLTTPSTEPSGWPQSKGLARAGEDYVDAAGVLSRKRRAAASIFDRS